MNLPKLLGLHLPLLRGSFTTGIKAGPSSNIFRVLSCGISSIISNRPIILPTCERTHSMMKPLLTLVPESSLIIPVCGLKYKGVIKRRCKDCFFVRRDGRMYVMCKSFPRHKQAVMAKKEKKTWIMSHAMQSKFRPY